MWSTTCRSRLPYHLHTDKPPTICHALPIFIGASNYTILGSYALGREGPRGPVKKQQRSFQREPGLYYTLHKCTVLVCSTLPPPGAFEWGGVGVRNFHTLNEDLYSRLLRRLAPPGVRILVVERPKGFPWSDLPGKHLREVHVSHHERRCGQVGLGVHGICGDKATAGDHMATTPPPANKWHRGVHVGMGTKWAILANAQKHIGRIPFHRKHGSQLSKCPACDVQVVVSVGGVHPMAK